MTTPRNLLHAAAAVLLLGLTSAGGLVFGSALSLAEQAVALPQVTAQMHGSERALAAAYPQGAVRVTVDIESGARIVQVRFTTKDAGILANPDATLALTDAAMEVALSAMPERETFDAAEFILVADSVASGPEMNTRRTMGDWEAHLDLYNLAHRATPDWSPPAVNQMLAVAL